VCVDFAKDEQRQPEYLAINPKERVPALVTDGGILTERLATLAFIAQSTLAAFRHLCESRPRARRSQGSYAFKRGHQG
jgi:glutathione S-transferase